MEASASDLTPAPPPNEPSHAKVVCSTALHALHGRERDDVELYPASFEHVKKLLGQLLRDAKIPSLATWQRALMPILMKCTDDVEPDVQAGDDMDIRHYIKLKKVPGGRPGDTSYVSGVVFSKNVALKSMARSISHPRIVIVTFAIEYARHEAHFMSLEPVIAQEREYLANLVGRIAALRPHVLLVQKHVSGLAVKMLEKAGITVAYNIKESVLAAVARVTQTVMIKSIDKLGIDPSHLGHCDSFEVKTYVSEGLRKTYIYLSGCDPDLGCTIVLRGGDTKTLRSIKRIAEFMCYVAYNLKLENYLMRDEFVSIPRKAEAQIGAHDDLAQDQSNYGDDTNNDTTPLPQDGAKFKYEQLEKEIRERVLSASPFVHFMQPYLLTQLRDLERKLATYSTLRDQYAAADEDGDEQDDDLAIHKHFELVKPDMVSVPASKNQPKAVREYLHAVHDAQLEKVAFTFQNHERQWETFVSGEVNPFDPFSHQQIVVLFSVVSSITSAPCTGPEPLGIGFYAGWNRADANNDEDMTLGQLIEDLCLSANSACKECNKKMCDHFRQYVHGYGQLTASIQRQPAKMRGYAHTILMWSTCRVCRQETTVTPMSDHTWKYSFAKYLELSFWSSPLHPRAGLCKHDIHKQFLRCFGFQDMVVRFQYDPIDIYDLVVPRGRVTWKVEADLEVKNEQYLQLETRLKAFTDSIKKRLDSINVDTLDEKKGTEALDYLDELRKRAEDDHDELMQKLQQKYARSRYYELLPLNRALRFMDEKALAWDEAFNDFEQNYFPSETDIRKLASIQLKNMFEQSQPPTSSVASGDSDTEDGGDITPTKGSLRRRKTHDELLSEKADDVLLSIVEEHKASADDGKSPHAVMSNDSETILPAGRVTPRTDLEEVVEREDVKHLDLAVPSRSPDKSTIEPPVYGEVSAQSDAADEGRHDENFAVQPKPLSSGLLERIEQIRNTRAQGSEAEVPESKIPRPVDRKKLEPSPVPPPLLRAQSQPGHVHRLSDTDHTIDAVATGKVVTDAAPSDKGLRERLGGAAGRLAGKVGKATPSLIPRSTPIKPEDSQNIVSSLAKHFEQLSREFEKERLKERRQRAMKSRQARANPLASSRPEVEVYRNATDAVGEKTLEQSARERDPPKDKTARRVMENHVADSQPEDVLVAEPATIGAGLIRDLTQNRGNDGVDHKDAGPATEVEAETEARIEAEVEAEMSEIAPTASRSRGASNSTSEQNSSFISPAQSGHDLTELGPDLTIPEHRKNVWFKYLAEFWSKRSASGWANLEYPLRNDEHVFADSDIIVREDEPSSVIALSLACADYRKKSEKFRDHPNRAPLAKHGHSHTPSQASAGYPPVSKEDEHRSDIEASLLSDTGTHMKYSFTHNSVRASCKIFYAESFDALRRRCNVADRFIESMSRCLKFDSKGGKTKSLFLRTLDNRFIIKSLQEVELKAFTKFAPDYFNFMSYTLFHGVPSVIAKMFGLFQVNIRNPNTGVDFSYYLLVMENLFYERNPNRRFDLKGSMRNRKIESTGQADEVLLDENLVETIFESPLFVREASRKLLQASIFNDTLWLCKQNVMDYSLMAGFDDTRKEMVVGIIDCIRTYTWDKKLESWIKDRGKNKPTITSPKDYRNRFRVSMMAYVLQAPNCWHQFQAQMPGPRTLKEKDDVKNETEDTEADVI
jgi:1-phosphatidylinositol-3-phosphate 5-kinase